MEESYASCTVPPGFRFHPTEEELVGYYLARKVASQKIDLDIIQEVDLYRIEPWDLQERCGGKYGNGGGGGEQEEQQTEWYFFSYKDRKYPSGTRTNRATAAGFWKATGRDKPVLSSLPSPSPAPGVIGMRKTLVFYRGRAPNGRKTDWIIHEYRLQSNEHAPTQEEGWVVCRAFVKPMPNQQHRSPYGGGAGSGAHPMMMSSSYSSNNYYYYDNPNAARLMVTSGAPNDHRSAESKKAHLYSDMPPPLQSPTLLDGGGDGDGEGYASQTSGSCAADQQLAAAAGAIDWNLWSSLLPPSTAQLFHGLPPPPAASSSSKNDDLGSGH